MLLWNKHCSIYPDLVYWTWTAWTLLKALQKESPRRCLTSTPTATSITTMRITSRHVWLFTSFWHGYSYIYPDKQKQDHDPVNVASWSVLLIWMFWQTQGEASITSFSFAPDHSCLSFTETWPFEIKLGYFCVFGCGVVVHHSLFPLELSLRAPRSFLCLMLHGLLITNDIQLFGRFSHLLAVFDAPMLVSCMCPVVKPRTAKAELFLCFATSFHQWFYLIVKSLPCFLL